MAELLAPAGDWDAARAAVENGADAVYFGLQSGFNARARATNFSGDDLPRLLPYLHQRGVKAYLTLNTLIFSDELQAAERQVREAARWGIDAILVQDLRLVRLIRSICPTLPIHASTQMTLTSSACIEVARRLGIARVVLPRELSVPEMERTHRETKVSLEAFVHGALCVAYSGQCLTSESLGGRSANRGQCAQACPLPYELVCDGHDVDLGNQQYLLSPQDLAAYALLPELLRAGVESFKIEGRLKSADYVANITRHYRRALDCAVAGQPSAVKDEDELEMEMSFSRGFSPGWLQGCDHKMLVPATSSAKRGARLGTVRAARGSRVRIELSAPLRCGDGIGFPVRASDRQQQGGRVYEIFVGRQSVKQALPQQVVDVSLAHGALDMSQIVPGQSVWKTDDPALTRKLKKTYATNRVQRRINLDLTVVARVGHVLRIDAVAETGCRASFESDGPLDAASKHPATQKLMQQQLGRLGHTAFQLRRVDVELQGAPMVPLSVIGRARRALIEQLQAHDPGPRYRVAAEAHGVARLRAEFAVDDAPQRTPSLHVLCRNLEQLRALCHCDVDRLYADFADIREYGQATELARQAGLPLFLATPRIQKPDEMGVFAAPARHAADGMLVRNLSGLDYCASRRIATVADYSLNAANELTVDLLRQWGAVLVTPSYDLNREQLIALLDHVPGSWLEVVVHQHMPLFHMEHCVFCAVLSPGTNKTNCGRPCDDHRVALRDRVGMLHPLTADVGCRNTLFNARAQSAAEIVSLLVERGVTQFRVELLEQDRDQAVRTVLLYRQLLAGTISGKRVWQQLGAHNRVGVTRGTLEHDRDPLAIL